MKKIQFYLFGFFFLIITWHSQSQIENTFFSKNEDGSFKFYFTDSFYLTCEKQADYFVFLNFNSEHFVLNDSIKAYYYKDKTLHLKGYINNGKREGEFRWYYPNGKIQRIGQYNQDKRDGTWRSYYSNGQLKKEVVYQNEVYFLKDFYLENGVQLVFNGEGSYVEEISLFSNPKNKTTLKGMIKEGLMDGKWDMYRNNSKIGTEYFENKLFIQGISISNTSQSVYTDTFYSTFMEDIYLENLSFDTNYFCGMQRGAKVRFPFELFKSIKTNYKKSELAQKIENGWFFVRLNYDSKGNINTAEIISNQNEEVNTTLKDIFSKTKADYKSYNVEIIVPIAIVNHEIFLSDDENILLFNR